MAQCTLLDRQANNGREKKNKTHQAEGLLVVYKYKLRLGFVCTHTRFSDWLDWISWFLLLLWLDDIFCSTHSRILRSAHISNRCCCWLLLFLWRHLDLLIGRRQKAKSGHLHQSLCWRRRRRRKKSTPTCWDDPHPTGSCCPWRRWSWSVSFVSPPSKQVTLYHQTLCIHYIENMYWGAPPLCLCLQTINVLRQGWMQLNASFSILSNGWPRRLGQVFPFHPCCQNCVYVHMAVWFCQVNNWRPANPHLISSSFFFILRGGSMRLPIHHAPLFLCRPSVDDCRSYTVISRWLMPSVTQPWDCLSYNILPTQSIAPAEMKWGGEYVTTGKFHIALIIFICCHSRDVVLTLSPYNKRVQCSLLCFLDVQRGTLRSQKKNILREGNNIIYKLSKGQRCGKTRFSFFKILGGITSFVLRGYEIIIDSLGRKWNLNCKKKKKKMRAD